MSYKSDLLEITVITSLFLLLVPCFCIWFRIKELPKEAFESTEPLWRLIIHGHETGEEYEFNGALSVIEDSIQTPFYQDSIIPSGKNSAEREIDNRDQTRGDSQAVRTGSEESGGSERVSPVVRPEPRIIPDNSGRRVEVFRTSKTGTYSRRSKGEAQKVEVNFVLEAGRRYQRNEDYFVRFKKQNNNLSIEIYFLDNVSGFSLEKYEYILDAVYEALEIYLQLTRDSFNEISYALDGNSRVCSINPSENANKCQNIVVQIEDLWREYVTSYYSIGQTIQQEYNPVLLLDEVYDQSKVETTFVIKAFNVFLPENQK